MAFENTKGLAEKVRLVEPVGLFRLDTVDSITLALVAPGAHFDGTYCLPMEVCRSPFRQNGIPHVDNQLQDLLVGGIWIHSCSFEFLLRRALRFGVSGMAREINLLKHNR